MTQNVVAEKVKEKVEEENTLISLKNKDDSLENQIKGLHDEMDKLRNDFTTLSKENVRFRADVQRELADKPKPEPKPEEPKPAARR